MNVTKTLGMYLAKLYLRNVAILLLGLMSVIYFFDVVELIRRASKFDDVSMIQVFQMGLLKLPEVGQVLLPFAILFAAMFTFWQLTKRYELVVVRSSGFSVWQFLLPVIAVAVMVGVLQMTAINPLGSVLIGKYKDMERTYLSHQKNQVSFSADGLWLRESLPNDGYAIIHSPTISQPGWRLNDVLMISFDADGGLRARRDAKTLELEAGQWVFKDLKAYENGRISDVLPQYILPTELTIADIEESFSSPDSISFWRLRGHIETLEDAGFNASNLRIHYHGLWAQPLLFAAMVLLAATVSMRPPRFSGGAKLFALGIFFGFVVFFLSSYLQALGASGQIPVILAAWAPALVTFLFGLSVLMTVEDG